MPTHDHDSVFAPTAGQSVMALQDSILNGTWYLRALLDALEKVHGVDALLLETPSGLACLGQEITHRIGEKVQALVRLTP